MKRTYPLLLLLVPLCGISYCQEYEGCSTPGAQRALSIQYSALNFFAHHDTLKPLKGGMFQHVELDALFGVRGSKSWHSAYRFPDVGVSLNYFNLGNDRVLGYGIGAYPFMVLRLAQHRRLTLNFRFGAGLAFVSKTYNPNQLPANLAVSMPINALVDLRVSMLYRLGSSVDLQLSALASHISNGAIKKPNHGLNSAGMGIGLTYRFGSSPWAEQPPTAPAAGQPYFLLTAAGAVKEVANIGETGGPKYYPVTLQLGYLKPLSSILELGGSIDMVRDESVKYYLRKQNDSYSPWQDNLSVGISGRIRLPLNKLALFGDLGLYLYTMNPRTRLIYERIGISYSMLERIAIALSLKAHYTVADHLDLGLAFKF